MDIKCKKTSCIYNNDTACKAGAITVGKDLDCKTFVKDGNLTDDNKGLFEAGEAFTNYKKSKTKKIECHAGKCLFNKNGNCEANGISVLSGRGKSAFCATNIEK